MEKLILQKLEKSEVMSTRKLWEEVFSEDSREFVDYYYSDKASENMTFVLKEREEIISMLHLTPYQAVLRALQRKEGNVSYIVGVATKETWRHKGCMRKLLCEAFLELYKRKEPFAFLMPADPEIYRPFSFEYIYERKEYFLHEGKLSEEKLVWLAEDNSRSLFLQDNQGETCTIRLANANDIGKLTAFAEAVLAHRYDFYLKHTEKYFKVLIKETESQKGGIFLFERQEKLLGYAVCALDGREPFFQEILLKEKGRSQLTGELFLAKEMKKPIIMARIMHIEAMLSMLESHEEKELLLEIEDKDIPLNQGIFQWNIGKGYSKVQRLQEEMPDTLKTMIKITIKELSQQIFTGKCSNPALEEAWKGIYVYKNGMLNEIV